MFEAQEDLEVVAACIDGARAHEAVLRHQPDVAILDLDLDDVDGVLLVRSIVRDCPSTRVLVLTGRVDNETIVDVLAAGARGYLPKRADAQELLHAIEAVHAGHTYLSASAQAAIAAHFREPPQPAVAVLTSRERAVLQLTADGLTAGQVAKELAVSPTTLKTHLQHLYEKLHVHTGPAAVQQAFRLGLLE